MSYKLHISGIYGRNYQPSDIPGGKLTHLNYAFANVDASGRVVLGDSYADTDKAYPGDVWDPLKQPFRGTFNQILNKVRAQHPRLKVLLSVGGWTWSARFSDAAATDVSRQVFAQSAFDILTKYGFDGIDIDWEYPVEGGLSGNAYRPADGANYVLLLNAIRAKIGPNKLISIASPAGPKLTRHLDIPSLAKVCDYINIMTYDFRGGWSAFTGHQTPLYPSSTDPDTSLTDTSTVVQYFLSQGMPPLQINIGAAVYGRGFSGIKSVTRKDGLFQQFTTVPKGSWDDGTSGATGVFDYKDVINKIRSGEMTRYWDAEVHAPYAYSDSEKTLISYDDTQSVTDKCSFVWQKQLGGVMIWELSGDDKTASLVDAIYSALQIPVEVLPTPTSVIRGTPPTIIAALPPPVIPNGPPPVSVPANPPPTSPVNPPPELSKTPIPNTCTNAASSCVYGQDTWACDKDSVVVCLPTYQWYSIACSAGTVCRVSTANSGVPYCVVDSEYGFKQCDRHDAPPQTPPAITPSGSACSGSDNLRCDGDQYQQCVNGRWMTRPCASGTKCKTSADGLGIICDFA